MAIFIILVCIGLAAGMLSGMIGIGGGIIIVPALIFLLGFSQHQAQGTSLALMLPPIGILAVYNYYKGGYLNITYAVIIAVTFTFGAYFGSKLAVSIDENTLKKIFGVVILAIAIKMLFGK